MTQAAETGRRTPWHLWVVCVIAVLWNGFGAYDYLATNLQGDAYLRGMGMTEPQIAYYHAMPAWMVAVWAIGVWGSVLGTALLLLRRRWAVHAFVASLAGLLVSIVYTHLLSDGGALMGQMGAVMNAVITAGCLFFVWYSWAMTKAGVLR